MLNRIKSAVGRLAVVAASVAAPVASHAAISAADQTAILTGVSGSDTLFYAIGGGILVVMSGIWGFKKVQGLLGR